MAQDLIVVGFKGPRRAFEVVSELRKLDEDWTIDLADAVSAYRTDDGQLRTIRCSRLPPGGRPRRHRRRLLAVSPPHSRGLSAAAAAEWLGPPSHRGTCWRAVGANDATDWKTRYGISMTLSRASARFHHPETPRCLRCPHDESGCHRKVPRVRRQDL